MTGTTRRGMLRGVARLAPVALIACGGNEAPVATAPPTTGPASVAPTPVVPVSTASAAPEKELILYSARKEDLLLPTVDAFQKKTGIKVAVKSGGSAELRLLIAQEAGAPKADVYFTTDYVDAELLRQKGVLTPHISALTDGVPAEFKAPDGAWVGVIGRSRNIIANTTLVAPDAYPTSIFDLTDPKWKGKLATSTLRDGMPIWLASLILLKGEAATTAFLTALIKGNGMKILNGGSDVANAVVLGEFALGLLNHYYYVPKKRAGAPVDLLYPDQGADQIGCLVTPLAAAVVKGAPHPNAAKAFVDFILTPEGAAPMTTMEWEFPLRPEVGLIGESGAVGVRTLGQFKRPPTFDINALATARDRAIELYTPLFT